MINFCICMDVDVDVIQVVSPSSLLSSSHTSDEIILACL